MNTNLLRRVDVGLKLKKKNPVLSMKIISFMKLLMYSPPNNGRTEISNGSQHCAGVLDVSIIINSKFSCKN